MELGGEDGSQVADRLCAGVVQRLVDQACVGGFDAVGGVRRMIILPLVGRVVDGLDLDLELALAAVEVAARAELEPRTTVRDVIVERAQVGVSK